MCEIVDSIEEVVTLQRSRLKHLREELDALEADNDRLIKLLKECENKVTF